MADDVLYKNLAALEPVKELVREAGEGLADPTRVIDTGEMREVLGVALGAGLGGAGSFAALYFLGTVGMSAAGITSGLATAGAIIGGGMVAGVGVLAAPAVALAAIGGLYFARKNKRRLAQTKEALLQEAVRMHDAVLRRIEERADLNEERADYLQALNISLRRAIHDLKRDLGLE